MIVTPRRRCLYFVVSFSLILGCFAISRAGDDWREVTPAELQMKSPKVESDADAEAIFWDVWIDDKGEGLTFQNYIRVKIFTERGREKFSKVDIPFGIGIKIKDLAARVVRQDGSISEVGPQDIFDREVLKAGGVSLKAKSFALPNVEPGVIVEYKYKEVREYGGASGMRLGFQRDIPIESLSYHYKPESKEPSYQSYNFTDTKFVKDVDGFYVARRINVPAFKEEPLMPPVDTVRPWMLLMADQIYRTDTTGLSFALTHKDRSDDPDRYWDGVAGNYGFIYAAYMNKPGGEIEKASKAIVSGTSLPEEKLRKLYDYCQNEIKNTNYDRTIAAEGRRMFWRSSEIAEALRRKSASAQTINLLFGSLAHALGFETRLALTGNRSEMFFGPTMANERFIHRAGVAVKVGDEWKFFKPGNPFLPYGMLNWYEEGSWVLLVAEKDYLWSHTPFTPYGRSVIRRIGKLRLKEDGTLDGEVSIEYSGHPAALYRANNYEESDERRERLLKDEVRNRVATAEVSELKVQNVMDPNKPLVQSYKIHIPGYAPKTPRRLLLQPGFFEYGVEPIFTSSSRSYDIYFPYPWSEYDLVEIELPKGYSLENGDSPGTLTDPGKIGSIDVRMQLDQTANVLHYVRRFYFGGANNIEFPVNAYPALKELFDRFHKASVHAVALRQNQKDLENK